MMIHRKFLMYVSICVFFSGCGSANNSGMDDAGEPIIIESSSSTPLSKEYQDIKASTGSDSNVPTVPDSVSAQYSN